MRHYNNAHIAQTINVGGLWFELLKKYGCTKVAETLVDELQELKQESWPIFFFTRLRNPSKKITIISLVGSYETHFYNCNNIIYIQSS